MKILKQHEIQMVSGGSITLLLGCLGALSGISEQDAIKYAALCGFLNYARLNAMEFLTEPTFELDYFTLARYVGMQVFETIIGHQVGIFLKT